MTDKFSRMARTLPSLYKAETNTMIRGLLKSWGVSDDAVTVNITETKNQIFINKASGRFLNSLGENVGVPRVPELGIEDEDFRNLIPVLSFFPKQVKQTIISLLDVFWDPIFTRANVTSDNAETFNFGPVSTLTGNLTFRKGIKLVKGVGTTFTTELQVGDFIKPASFDGTTYTKISEIIDDENLILTLDWENDVAVNVATSKGVIRELKYINDKSTEKTIRFKPNAFSDITAVTNLELVTFINSELEHNVNITVSEFVDPIAGNKLNIRTNTVGLQGSVQITGGDAVSILNFDTILRTETKCNVFQLNPNEVVVKIPSSVPVLRRSLRGSAHLRESKAIIFSSKEPFDFSGLGASSTINIDVDGNSVVITLTHATDFKDSAKASALEVAEAMNKQIASMDVFNKIKASINRVGLRTIEGSAEYQITGGTANAVLNFDTSLQTDPDIIVIKFPSAYIFDPINQLFTVTGTSSDLTTKVEKGSVSTTLNMDDASGFQNKSGKFMINFGKSNQEGPIIYNSRPNNSSLLIDASHIFSETHEIGSKVNFIVDIPTIPRVTGVDTPVFIVGTEEAREGAERLIKSLLASGVVIRFIIEFPEFLFECTVAEKEGIDDVGFKGSLTGSGPLVF